MKANMFELGFESVDIQECSLIAGGVDKKAQDALYTIGYILGVVAKFVSALFIFKKEKQVVTA